MPARARIRCFRRDDGGDMRLIIHGDERHARLGDARLLGGDLGDCVAEERLMVDAELGDAADQRRGDDVGRVQPAAKADFDDAGIGRMFGKGKEGHRRRHLEEARPDVARNIEHAGEIGGQRIIRDQRSVQPDPLIEAHQMGGGEHMDAAPFRLQRGAQEGAGRAFAVGARDMEHRRQRAMRVAQPLQQAGDAVQPQYVRPRRQCGEPVELGLDLWIVGNRVIGHRLSSSRGEGRQAALLRWPR